MIVDSDWSHKIKRLAPWKAMTNLVCACLVASVVSDSVSPWILCVQEPHGPGSSVHGVLQAGILEWVAITTSRDDKPRQHIKKKQDHGIHPHCCMANRGEKVEAVTDFLFSGSKIPAYGDCSHEIRRQVLGGRKVMINPDSVLKSRDTPLLTKVSTVKATSSQWSCTVARARL